MDGIIGISQKVPIPHYLILILTRDFEMIYWSDLWCINCNFKQRSIIYHNETKRVYNFISDNIYTFF